MRLHPETGRQLQPPQPPPPPGNLAKGRGDRSAAAAAAAAPSLGSGEARCATVEAGEVGGRWPDSLFELITSEPYSRLDQLWTSSPVEPGEARRAAAGVRSRRVRGGIGGAKSMGPDSEFEFIPHPPTPEASARNRQHVGRRGGAVTSSRGSRSAAPRVRRCRRSGLSRRRPRFCGGGGCVHSHRVGPRPQPHEVLVLDQLRRTPHAHLTRPRFGTASVHGGADIHPAALHLQARCRVFSRGCETKGAQEGLRAVGCWCEGRDHAPR
eukprot:22496-Chlamydomonas_euryale.AAC.2